MIDIPKPSRRPDTPPRKERRMVETECFGVKKGEMRIFAMHFPYRKKIGLGIYDSKSNMIVKVATFKSDESAKEFMSYLADFVGAERKEE